ncbi:MAG: NifU family protein [Candidatus Parcubacteria bacterium]|nr:NifU family protein [Candidatus Parcubacteria bacterium]
MVINKNLKEKIEEALGEIRPILQADGGDIELIDWLEKEGTVKVRLTGGCAHCPMAQITLKNFVEKTLKNKLPEIKQVEAI